MASKNKDSEPSTVDIDFLRNQLLFISILVFFVGIISTESYYQEFGLKYQQLGFPTFHVMYRGIVTVIYAWYLLLPYAAAVIWISTLGVLVRRTSASMGLIVSYIIIIVLAGTVYLLAQKAGFAQAQRDMVEEESTLPSIECIRFDRADSCDSNYVEYRHLITTEGQVLILQPVARAKKAATDPYIIHLPQGDIHELQTSKTRLSSTGRGAHTSAHHQRCCPG